MNLNRQKVGRNIVFCNFSLEEKNSISFSDIRDEKECWNLDGEETHRFPYIKYVENLKELFRSQGFMAVIKLSDVKMDIPDFDKKYWKSFKKYNYIAIVDESHRRVITFNKYSKIGFVNYDLFFSDSAIWILEDMYEEVAKEHSNDISSKTCDGMEKILKILELYAEISSLELAKILNKSTRTIERYMLYLADTEYPVRYNNHNRKWYLLK